MPPGVAADSAGVARLLGGLTDLSAVAFATPAQRDSARFGTGARRVLVRGARGDKLADLALDSTRAGYWVRSAGDSVVYRIPLSLGRKIAPEAAAMHGS